MYLQPGCHRVDVTEDCRFPLHCFVRVGGTTRPLSPQHWFLDQRKRVLVSSNSTLDKVSEKIRPVGRQLRHLQKRLVREIGKRYNNVEALIYDLRHGVETRGKASMSDMGFEGDLAEHGTGFQSVNARHLRKMLRTMQFPKSATFIDVGSGKGKVLFLARDYGFARVVGVELASELGEVARRNRQHLGAKYAQIEIVDQNALEYPFTGESVINLFNPFDSHFLEQFLDHLEESLTDNPRPAWLLYGNPMYREVVDARASWVQERQFHFPGPGRDVVIYRFVRS